MIGFEKVYEDLEGFCKSMKIEDNWKNVPSDRFQRRIDFLEK